MRPPSYMRSVVDRNVVIRRITVYSTYANSRNLEKSCNERQRILSEKIIETMRNRGH